MGHKVFIVEDEPDLRDTLKYNLENEGFNVEAFSNGEAFLGSVDKNKPNLVILDLMLPGVSGLDVCRKLRSNDNYDGIGIVMRDDGLISTGSGLFPDHPDKKGRVDEKPILKTSPEVKEKKKGWFN